MMDFLGVGPLEFFFILIIILIVLGPGEMVKASQTLGRALRKLIKSPTWQLIRNTSNSLRNLPNTLAREAGAEEFKQELLRGTEEFRKIGKEIDPTQWGENQRIKPDFIPEDREGESEGKEARYSAWTTPTKPEHTLPPQENAERRVPPSSAASDTPAAEPSIPADSQADGKEAGQNDRAAEPPNQTS